MTTTPTPKAVEALAMAIYCHSPDDEMPVGLIREMAAKACIERLYSLGYTITRAEPAPLPDEVEKLLHGVCDYLHHEGSKDKLRAHIAAQAQDLKLNLIARDAAFKRVAELEAENKRLREANQWKPIESSPRDGTPVLCRFKDMGKDELFSNLFAVLRFTGPYTMWGYAGPVGHGGFPDSWLEVWMPLPEPPVAAQKQPEVSDKAVCGYQVSDKQHEPQKCGTCGGDGIEKYRMKTWNRELKKYEWNKCPDCNGTGKVGE